MGSKGGRPLVPGRPAVPTPSPEALPSALGACGCRRWSVWVGWARLQPTRPTPSPTKAESCAPLGVLDPLPTPRVPRRQMGGPALGLRGEHTGSLYGLHLWPRGSAGTRLVSWLQRSRTETLEARGAGARRPGRQWGRWALEVGGRRGRSSRGACLRRPQPSLRWSTRPCAPVAVGSSFGPTTVSVQTRSAPMGMPGCARTLRTRAVGSQAASLHLQPRGHPSSVRLEAIAGPRAWLPVPRVPRPLQVCVPGHPGTRPRADSCPGPTEACGGPPQLLPGRGVDRAQRLSCSEKGWVPG